MPLSHAGPAPLAEKGKSPDGLIASPEEGWPQWRGPRRDGISTERDLLANWPAEGPRLLWKAEGLGRGWSSPIVTGGAVFVTGDVGANLVVFSFDLRGHLNWKNTNGLAWAGPYPGARACCAYSQGVVYHLNEGCVFYVTTDGVGGSLYRLAPGDAWATLIWKTPVDALTSSGVLVDGALFTSGSRRTKSLHCLDWRTGQERAVMRLGTGNSAFASIAMVWADGRLYCQVEDGTVALLKPRPGGFEVAGRFQLVDARSGDAWAHPVLLHGRLYLRYHETLWCYDVRGQP